ncbi:YczE/YyaS/YitT family protein [Rummeliibacillus sp. JY-2-4R]
MENGGITAKRLTIYIVGLFILALGISFSIVANLGVSPVSSLAYAIALASGISVGITTILANIVFIVIQIIINHRINLKDFCVQLIVAFIFGFFINATLWITRTFLPTPNSAVDSWIYMIISLFVVAFGLVFYLNSKLPLMPYDALTYVISDRFKWIFGKAKIISDIANVILATIVCLVTIHELGSIGIGTVIAAYMIGKIIGFYMKFMEKPLNYWLYKSNPEKEHQVHM